MSRIAWQSRSAWIPPIAPSNAILATPVTLTSLAITQSQLKINKRGDRAKLQLKASGTGSSAAGSGSGKYRYKATGAWQAATPI